MNILMIHNTKSGPKSDTKYVYDLKTKLKEKGNTKFIEVSNVQSMYEVVSLIPENDLIIIIAGDGTVSYFSNYLIEYDKPVLVIPNGSGNDFSKSIGASVNIEEILKIVEKFDIFKTSTMLINEKERRLTIACFGFEARVNRLANKLPRAFGKYKYSIATVLSLFGRHYETLKIESDSFFEEGEYSLAIIANTPSFGGGLMISNKASALDDKLYLILVNRVNKFKLIYLFLLLILRKHYSRPEFREFVTKEIKVDSIKGVLRSQADGESLPEGPVVIKIEPQSLKVLLV
ncbi:MAG: hypothetical protein RLZZ37_181 [Actinomycetota bacterium]|jgi:diacylglycerol kinase (ATP)